MKKSDECMGLFGSMRDRREPIMGLCALHSVLSCLLCRLALRAGLDYVHGSVVILNLKS
jgi:hypothetical protein